MRSRKAWLAQRVRARLRLAVRGRPPELDEIIERLDRLLYLTENEARAVDEALSAILERLRLLEAQRSAGDAAREPSTTDR
jgi:hypothetical protein